ARTIINDHSTPTKFRAEVVNTACYVTNRVLIRFKLNKTPYGLLKNRTPNIGYFYSFGCRCFILNMKDSLGKFDSKSNESIFLGHSSHNKAFRVFNKRSGKVEESIHVIFDKLVCAKVITQENEVDIPGISIPTSDSIKETHPGSVASSSIINVLEDVQS
ncbi:Copia protein, partial [Linum grandiflorum]